MIAGPARSVAQATAAQIRDDRPDRVVASFVAFGAMIAAEAAAVDFDVLIPNIYPAPVRGIPPTGMGLRPARTPVGRIRDALLNALATRVLGHYALPPLNAARNEFGLPPLRQHWDQVRAARRRLVLSSAAFEFPGGFPASVRHVGPVLDDPSWADAGQAAGAGEPTDGGEPEWTPPPGEGPLVLVSLSSTYQGQRNVVQNVIDALRGLPVRGLVTTGMGLDPQRLRDGGRVQVVRSVPHRQVMKQADLVITHGGHGTVMKALVAGVPMVVLPHGRDQPDDAVCVEARGAGLRLPKDASPQTIAEAVEITLSTPAHRASAQRLGGLIREEMTNGRLLEELEAEH